MHETDAKKVQIPRNQKVEFPDRCIYCDCVDPGSHIGSTMWTRPFWSRDYWYGEPFRIAIPACRGCKRKARVTNLCGVVILFALLVVLQLVMADATRIAQFVAFVAAGGVLVMVLRLVSQLWIPYLPLRIKAFADHVDYRFKSPRYAADFANLNGCAQQGE